MKKPLHTIPTFLFVSFILFHALGFGSARSEEPATPARLAIAGPEAGVNITSVGNSYSDPQFQDESLDRLFTELKKRGITRISLRVTWATMERQEGSLDPKIMAAMKRIYGKAQTYGFKAMLDFHTLFMKDNYACPEWVAQHRQDDGSPCVRSIAMIARSKSVRERYLAYVAGVVSEMKVCPAIDVVSVMNEPFSMEWRNPSRWADDMDQIQSVIEEAARIVREKAPGRRVAVRFCGAVNPWGHNPERRFDAERMLKVLDIIGQNIYLDPNDDNAVHQDKLSKKPLPALSWPIMAEAAERCRKAGKAFWITEFGAPWQKSDDTKEPSGTLESQKIDVESYCKRFWGNSIRPEAVMIWVLQANPKNLDKYGVYDGATSSFRPAFDVYTKYSIESLSAKQSKRQSL